MKSSIEMQMWKFMFLISILLPVWHAPGLLLFCGNKFSACCDAESSHSSGQSWQQLRKFASEVLEESSCQSSLVTTNNRAEQQNGKHECLDFYLPKQCRDEVSHWWGIPVHWQIGITGIATANAACWQQERIRDPPHLPFCRRSWGCTHIQAPASTLCGFPWNTKLVL